MRSFKSVLVLSTVALSIVGTGLDRIARAEDKPIVVWDGDTAANGSGWSAPKNDANLLKQDDKEVKAGKKSISFHAEGKDWTGFGWNWQGWYPADAGTDISGCDKVTFWLKVTGSAKPASLTFHLTSNNKKATTDVKIETYVKSGEKFDGGEWHQITIPLKDLYGDKTEFDSKAAWEFDIGEWSPDSLNYTIYVDSVTFTKS